MTSQADVQRRRIIKLLPRLRRFALALTGQRHDADDLLQATVERLLDRGIPADADAPKWAFRVCKNIWIDEIRSRRTRAGGGENRIDDARNVQDGERIVMNKVTLTQVNRAMSSLPDDQRAALALVALEGCSYADAAHALGVPVGTIMSRVARARRKLADHFSSDDAHPADVADAKPTMKRP